MSPPIRILVVDDTITYRSIMANVVKSIPDTELAGSAANGQDALDALGKMQVDLVLLDVEMPIMGGMEALPAIQRRFPNTGVVLISGTNRDSADATIKALEAGALDFIAKPDNGSIGRNMEALQERLSSILSVFRQRKGKASQPPLPAVGITPPAQPKPTPTPEILPAIPKHAGRFEVLVIGVSTGGPNALNEVIPALPKHLGIPILIVQHMPPIFTDSLAKSLDRKSQLTVKEAQADEHIQPNTVYIAPGGYHMAITKEKSVVKVLINQDPPENSCRPAVDVLFRSVSQAYGANVLSVIMTGMGSDGAKGVQAIKAKGGYCVTQSADTCVVYGMPKAVDDLRLSDEKIPLSQLAQRLYSLVQTREKREVSL